MLIRNQLDDIEGVICSTSNLLADVVMMIDKNHGGTVLCVDPVGKLMGTITDGDVRRGLIQGCTLSTVVSQVMNTSYKSCKPMDDLEVIDQVFKLNKINCLPIVADDDKLLGAYTKDETMTSSALPALEAVIPVIMAGGKGKRLLPLTEKCPKPLLKIGDKPMLQIILEKIAETGFRKIFISVGYLADKIIEFVDSELELDLEVFYIFEETPLGTAGALSSLSQENGISYLIINGDVLTDLNLYTFLNFHIDSHAKMTIASRLVCTQVPYGVIQCDDQGWISSVEEKPNVSHKVSAGVYLLESSVLNLIPRSAQFDMPDLINACIESEFRVMNFPIHERWIDIGLPRTLQEARDKWG